MSVESEYRRAELPFEEEPDPVVRMPKRMVMLADDGPAGVGLRLVLGVALLGAALGGSLGAVGLGIVHATRALPSPVALATLAPVLPAAPTVTAVYALAAVASADAGVVAPGPQFETTQQAIGVGRPLAQALRAVGVPRAEVGRAIAALDRFLNMRALQPDDRVAAMREPGTRTLLRVEYRRAATQVWAAVGADVGQWRGGRARGGRAPVNGWPGVRSGGPARAPTPGAPRGGTPPAATAGGRARASPPPGRPAEARAC